jgi:hypothetical protein
MYDELFEEGIPIKRELRLLVKTLRNPALISALEYIDKLEVQLVTAEGTKNAIESRGIKKPITEIFNDLRNKKTEPIVNSPVSNKKIKNPTIEKKDLPVELQNLGDKVIESFIILVKESPEWGGKPCVGSSEAGSSLRGALPHLKKAGLLTTIVKQDGSQRGTGTYVQFTTLGRQVAEKIEQLLVLIDPL